MQGAGFRQCTVKLKGYDEPVTAWGLRFGELADVLNSAQTVTTIENSDRTGIFFPPNVTIVK